MNHHYKLGFEGSQHILSIAQGGENDSSRKWKELLGAYRKWLT